MKILKTLDDSIIEKGLKHPKEVQKHIWKTKRTKKGEMLWTFALTEARWNR